jgi:hypothetical protein
MLGLLCTRHVVTVQRAPTLRGQVLLRTGLACDYCQNRDRWRRPSASARSGPVVPRVFHAGPGRTACAVLNGKRRDFRFEAWESKARDGMGCLSES